MQAVAAIFLKQHEGKIDELRMLIHRADADRASRLLLELCEQFPLLAGVVALLRQGSIDQAVDAIAMFDSDLGDELREQTDVLREIHKRL
jgi:hypothetical protein